MEALWTAIGAALAIAGSAFATAWAQSRIGAAAAAALAEKPELRTTAVLLVAIPETMVILGFVVAVLIVLQGG
jgi:V/A-type H+-transporting ATPase subunit K